MSLDRIVNVQVNINQSTIAQQGFGTPLIFAHHAMSERVMTFSAATWQNELVTALGGVDDASKIIARQNPAYRAANAMMMLSPRPVTFKVGRKTTAETQVVHIIPAVVANTSAYIVTVLTPEGTTETGNYPSDASATAAEICTGLAAVINAMTTNLTADGTSGTHVVVTAPADRIYSYVLSTNLRLEDHSTADAAGIAADLTAINDEDSDWYALALASSAPAAIEAAADWVELNKKLFVASTHDSRPLTNATDDIVSSIDTQNYPRTHVSYNSRAGNFYGAAWSASMLPYQPGQADWKYKTLKGQIADKLTAAQETYLLNKGGSFYERAVGQEFSGAAKGGDGVFLDLTQLSDWLEVRTVEGIVGMLLASPTKIPLNDQGAGNSIWGVLKTVVEGAIQNGAVDEDPETWSIYVPKKKDLAPADIAARTWTGCSLNVTPTSALHSVGTITVNINVTA